MYINKLITIATVMISLIQLQGCIPLIPLSIAAGTTMILSDERSMGNIVDDNMITARIKSKLSSQKLLLNVHVHVFEGRVLLTGNIGSISELKEITKIAWQIKGVKEVINVVEVNNKNLADSAKDTMLENAISSKMLLEKNFKSKNYITVVNNNIAYILGVAQTQQELDIAINIVSSINGIQKVVNYVILKDDPRRMN